jgi:hypothetical protein
LKLKEMLKEQEESNKTKLEEKEEKITRLKNEKEDINVDDEISKVLKPLSISRPKLKKPK